MRFLTAVKRLLESEGGYSNRANDRGGETYRGISRKNFPDWQGWKVIDQYKAKGLLKSGMIITALEDMVNSFYKANFWELVKCDSLPECLRMQVFDIAVNSGIKTAGKLLQAAINRVSDTQISEDGVIGEMTCKAAREEPLIINAHLFALRLDRYYNIVKADASQREYKKGWYLRAMREFDKSET